MSTVKPGVALKRLRTKNQWTLADVHRMTGIPPSTLSRIENDQLSPTYDLLVRMSTGLAIDLSEMLSSHEPSVGMGVDQAGRRSVNRLNEGDTVLMPHHSLRYLSTDFLNKQITPILCEYQARSLAEFGEFMRHAGEEFLYVVEGELELHTEYYAPLILRAGESTYFDSRMGHAYIARGSSPCRALSVCTLSRPDEITTPDAEAATTPFPRSKVLAKPSRPAKAKSRKSQALRAV